MSTEGYKYRPEYPALMENGQIPEGLQSAHKEGMLRVAHEAFERGDFATQGVFVPRIFDSLDEAVRAGNPFWMRGYYNHMVDGFAVDSLPTTRVDTDKRYGFSGDESIASAYYDDTRGRAEHRHERYLKNNFFQKSFGVDPGPPQFFFQEDAFFDEKSSHLALPMTVINDSDNTYHFDTAISPLPPRGAGSFQITENTTGDLSFRIGDQTNRDYIVIARRTGVSLLGNIKAIIAVFDNHYGSPKGRYSYKLDLEIMPSQLNTDKSHMALLQARIVTANGLQKPGAQEKIDEMVNGGVDILDCEMMNLPKILNNLDKPRILSLIHRYGNTVKREGSDDDPQLQNIAGVQAPPCFDRGILSHGGYGVVAYANYWGIPFVFAQ